MLALAQAIAKAVRLGLCERLARTGHDGDSLKDPEDLKSSHVSDEAAIQAALKVLAGRRANVFIESEPAITVAKPEFSVYIDPLDGSLNWDRGVGDPAVVIATAPGPGLRCLDDLAFAYVLGLRSGDEYWTEDGTSHYRCALTGSVTRIATRPEKLAAAIAYIRPGYGGAKRVLGRTAGLQCAVRDIRAVDNTGLELCEIARGAAHMLVEVRELSDGFNLLAWPILRNAGGALLDLEGRALAEQAVDLGENYDYIAASSLALALESLAVLDEKP